MRSSTLKVISTGMKIHENSHIKKCEVLRKKNLFYQIRSLLRLRGSRGLSPYSSSAKLADEDDLWQMYLLHALSSSKYRILPPISDYSYFALPFHLQQCLQNVLCPLWVHHCATDMTCKNTISQRVSVSNSLSHI